MTRLTDPYWEVFAATDAERPEETFYLVVYGDPSGIDRYWTAARDTDTGISGVTFDRTKAYRFYRWTEEKWVSSGGTVRGADAAKGRRDWLNKEAREANITLQGDPL